MRLEPTNGRLALRRLEPRKITPGGIHLPDESQEKSEVAMVLAVSRPWVDDNGVSRESQFEPGDLCAVSKYAGQEFDLDGGRLSVLLIEEGKVLARIVDGDRLLAASSLAADLEPVPA